MSTITQIWRGGRSGRSGFWLDTRYPGSVAARLSAVPPDDLFVSTANGRVWIALERAGELVAACPETRPHVEAPALPF